MQRHGLHLDFDFCPRSNDSRIMRLTFGKFNGQKINDVPRWYLVWLSNKDWFGERFPQLAEAVAHRLDGGDDTSSRAITADLFKSWRSRVLVKWHPDRDDGSHVAFVAVNDAIEMLGKLLADKGVSA